METRLQQFADRITDYLPNIIGALVVLLIGWLIAKALEKLIYKILDSTKWGQKVMKGSNVETTNHSIAKIVYYLIMLFVLLITLEILEIRQVLDPIKNMLNKILEFIPNIIGAVIIAFIGYLLAKFISSLINIGGSFLDKIVDKTGFKDTNKLVNIIQKIVFIVIFIPF